MLDAPPNPSTASADVQLDAKDPKRWWALGVLCVSLLVIGLDNTILNVALPALVRDLHAGTSQLQWIVDGYTLVFAGLLLTAGSLGDRFGRRGALGIGLGIFGVGSLASGLAGSANVLIFTRATAGIGAALIMPATLSLLTNIFSDPKERAQAIGIWAAVAGGGSAIGPLLGGFLLKHFSWGSVFFVNVPVVIVGIIGGRLLLPASKDPDAPRLDPIGAVLSIVGLVGVLWAVIEGPAKGWGSLEVVGPLVAGVLVLAGFIAWELTSSHPMLDVRFFSNPRFSAANGAITLTFFAMFGASFLITQYLQTVLGYSPLSAGARMLPMAVTMMLVAPFSPRLVNKVGTKAVVTAGLTIAGLGVGWISLVPTTGGYPHLVLGMGMMALGMGLVMAPATESIMGSLPPAKAGVGSAMNDTTRQMGGALGVAVIGSVLASGYRPGITTKLSGLGLSAEQLQTAKDSIGGAVQVASELPKGLGDQVAALARGEFVSALQGAMLVGMVVLFAAAAVAGIFLPSRAAAPDEPIALDEALEGFVASTSAEADAVLEPALSPTS